MHKLLEYLNKILLYGLLVNGLIWLFFNLRTSIVIISLAAFLSSLALTFVIDKKGLKDYSIFINLALWINLCGEMAFYYGNYFGYDKILHFSVGLFITIIVYENFHKNLKIDKQMIFFVVLGMLCAWEILEYSTMAFFDFPSMGVFKNGAMLQSPLDDTMYDLIMGSLGSLVYLIFRVENVGPRLVNLVRKNSKKKVRI